MCELSLHPISHRFQDMADYWSNFGCRQGGCLGLTHSFGVNSDIQYCELETSLLYRTVWKVLRCLTSNRSGQCDRRTDRRTDTVIANSALDYIARIIELQFHTLIWLLIQSY